MRASTAMTPCSSTIRGLISSSRISGSSLTMVEIFSNKLIRACLLTGGSCLKLCRYFAAFVLAIIFSTIYSLRGGKAIALSCMISTIVPPRPKLMAGPKTGSLTTPIINSRPLIERYIGSTVISTCLISGCFCFIWVSIS